MSFLEIMECILIGVITGLVTSGVTSVIVYHITEYQKELESARRMVDDTYQLQNMLMLRAQYENENSIKPTVNIRRAITSEQLKDFAIKAGYGFSIFEPWKYKQPLRDALIKINEILSDNETYEAIDKGNISNIILKLEEALEQYDNCDRNMIKDFIKEILKNWVIRISRIALIAIIIITLVAYILTFNQYLVGNFI